MRQWIGLAALVFVGIAGWRIAGQLSADALGMAVGVLFGVMAGVPAALLVMASGRRRAQAEAEEADAPLRRRQPQGHPGHLGYPQQGYPQQGYPGYNPGYGQDPYGAPQRMRALPPPETVDVRQFKVIGEKEEWVDEW